MRLSFTLHESDTRAVSSFTEPDGTVRLSSPIEFVGLEDDGDSESVGQGDNGCSIIRLSKRRGKLRRKDRGEAGEVQT